MISFIRRSRHDEGVKTIRAYRPGSWVFVEDPSEEDLTFLEERLSVDAGHLLDALDPNEVPRYEVEREGSYIFTRVPQENKGAYVSVPVLFVIRTGCLVTVSKKDIQVFDHFTSGRRRFITTNRIGLFIHLMGEIVESYQAFIAKINKRVSATSINVDRIENRDIIAFVGYEHVLNEYLNAIVQTNAILKTLVTSRNLSLRREERELMEDLFLATGQLIALSKSSLQNVKNIRDAYSTIMTNNLNHVIKFFTTLTVVMTVPTVIASFYGMNVRLPGAHSDWAFFAIAAITLVVAAGSVMFFLKKRWL